MGVLDNLEDFSETQRGGFFQPKNNKNKTVFLEYKGFDEKHPGYQGRETPMVNLNIVVLEDDGSFTEYNNQWVKGAVIITLFKGSKSGKIKEKAIGWCSIRKVVQLPANQGQENGAWAFNGTDQESFDKVKKYIADRDQAVSAATESGSLPWDTSDDEGDSE